MNITQPDLDVGRCQNYRWFPSGRSFDAMRVAVRCNDYEGTEHVCTFTPPPVVESDASWSQSSSTLPHPKPWVRPENVARVPYQNTGDKQ